MFPIHLFPVPQTSQGLKFFKLIHNRLKNIIHGTRKKKRKHAWMSRKTTIFAPQLRTNVQQFAQMAESVDALVSNTSGFTSIPVRPRVWVLQERLIIK